MKCRNPFPIILLKYVKLLRRVLESFPSRVVSCLSGLYFHCAVLVELFLCRALKDVSVHPIFTRWLI